MKREESMIQKNLKSMLLALLLSLTTAAGAQSYFNVTVETMTGGSISAVLTAQEGTEVTLNVTPDATHYLEAADISVLPSGNVAQGRTRIGPDTGQKQTVTAVEVNAEGQGTFKFTMPAWNVTVDATFHSRTDISTGTTVTLDAPAGGYAVDGLEHKPAVTGVTYGSTPLLATGSTSTVNGKPEYEVVYPMEDYSTRGTMDVTVKGRGKYMGLATTTFSINPRHITADEVVPSVAALTYNGEPQVAPITIVDNQRHDPTVATSPYTLVPNVDYMLANSLQTNAGTYNVTVSGLGDYDETRNVEFTIAPLDLSTTALTLSESTYVFDGAKKIPSVTVTTAEGKLISNSDYLVTYADNVNYGTATVTVTANGGNTINSKSATFTITKSALTITAGDQTVTYGTAISQNLDKVSVEGLITGGTDTNGETITHTLKGITLTASTDQVITNGTITPSAAVINDGSGNNVAASYAITYVPGNLTILPKDFSSGNITISGLDESYVYTGQQVSPVLTIKNTEINETLVLGKDYDVSYENNLNVGTATLTVTFKGNYSGSTMRTYNIIKRPVTITAKDQTVVFGTDITLGTSMAETEGLADGHTLTAITLTPSTDQNVTDGTITPSAPTISDAQSADVTSNYSISYVDGKLTILQKASENLTVDDIDSYEYNGALITPKPVVRDLGKVLTEDTDYEVNYENNKNAGTASVIITFKGNYSGALIPTFDITKRPVTVTALPQTVTYGTAIAQGVEMVEIEGLVSGHVLNDVMLTPSTDQFTTDGTITASGASIADEEEKDVTANYAISYVTGKLTILQQAGSNLTATLEGTTYTYSGSLITPAVTVKDGDKALTEGTDYDLNYENNKNVGTAKVTVTFKGNYSGSLSLTFTITKLALTVIAKPQTVDYGVAVSSLPGDVTVEGLLPEHQLTAVILTPSTTMPTTDGTLTPSAAVITDGQGANVTANYDITYTGGLLTIILKEVEDDDVTVVIEEDEDGKPTGCVTDVEDKPVVNIPETVIGPDGEEIPVTKIDADAFEGKEDIHDIYIPQHFELEIEDPTFNGWCTPEKGARVHVYQTLLKTYADGQLKDLVADGLLVTDIVSQNDMFTFSNAFNTILPEGVRQHICRVVDNQVHKYEVKSDVINRETGVLLTAKPGTHVFVATTRTTPASLYAGNELRPVMESEHISEVTLAYLLTMNEFHKMNLNNSIPDGKAYLQWPDPATYQAAPARLQLAGDETGIGSVNSARESECWFDLMGNRIEKPARKGVYILNGRKTVVK